MDSILLNKGWILVDSFPWPRQIPTSMIGIRTAFLLSLSVVTAPLCQRHVGANADVAPDAFAADTFDYIVVGKEHAIFHTTS